MYLGIATAAKIPNIIVTIINSISVNPLLLFLMLFSLVLTFGCGFGVLVCLVNYGCNFFQNDDGLSRSATNIMGAID